MGVYTAKRVEINGKPYAIVQNSLNWIGGYGETKVRTEIVGNSTEQVNSDDLETAVSQVMFSIITKDSDDSTDPRVLVRTWKQNKNANAVTILPDGVGQNMNFANMSLVNDPKTEESPDGVIALEWKGKTVQLS